MLGRKATRIDLKPEDRDEYFAHKQGGKAATESNDANKEKQPSDKEVRIGLVNTR